MREPLREELLGGRLVLGLAVLEDLLHLVDLVGNGGITGGQLQGFLEVLQSVILLLEAHVGEGAAVVGLGLVAVLGLGIIGDLERVRGPSLGILEVAELDGQQGGVRVQGESQGLHLLAQLLGVIVAGLGELVQVAQTLLVLVQAQSHLSVLERSVAEALQFGSNLEAQRRGQLARVVLGKVLVGVAGRILDTLVGALILGALEFTAVHHNDVDLRLVGLGLHVLDLANDALAIDNLAENNVLAIEVGGWNGGDEELATVGAGAGVGHGEQEGAVMLEVEILIGELLAVDRFAAGTVERSKVTTLDHELLDDPVENRVCVASGSD